MHVPVAMEEAAMMSSAIAMTIGTGQQVKPGAVTADQGEGPGISFADSLGKQLSLQGRAGLREAPAGAAEGLTENKSEVGMKADEPPALPVKTDQEAVASRLIPGSKDDPKEQKVSAGRQDQVSADMFVKSKSRSLSASEHETSFESDNGQKITSAKAVGAAAQPKAPPVKDIAGSRSELSEENGLSEGTGVEADQKALPQQMDSSAADTSKIDSAVRDMTATSRLPPAPEIRSSIPEPLTVPVGTTVSLHEGGKEPKTDPKSTKDLKKTGVEAPAVANTAPVADITLQPVQSFAQNGGSLRFDENAEEKASDPVSVSGVAVTGNRTKVVDGAGRKDALSDGSGAAKDSAESISSTEAQHSSSVFGDKVSQTVASAATPDKDVSGKTESSVVAVAPAHSALAGDVAVAGAVSGTAAQPSVEGIGLKIQSHETGSSVSRVHSGSGERELTGAGIGETETGHRTLVATPTTLEVGIPNGTQGWLKVRADMAGDGVVNASLSSTTSAGQDQLHRELPALTSYLHEERIAVNTVVVHTAASGGGFDLRSGAGSDGERRGQAQQHESHGGRGQQQNLTGPASEYSDESPWIGLHESGVDGALSGETYTGGGWLNVRV